VYDQDFFFERRPFYEFVADENKLEDHNPTFD